MASHLLHLLLLPAHLAAFITHLILVDDGSEGEKSFGREAGLRSMLPQIIRCPSSIPGGYGAPCVCVLIQGDAQVRSLSD